MDIAMPVQAKENKLAPSGVLGMLFVLATEAMFFAGLISAYIVNKAGTMMWPPQGQPRLPVEITSVNTLFLLASAVTVYLFGKKMKAATYVEKKPSTLLLSTMILGGTFLIVQGTEWVKLIGYGLTTHSSIYGAFFYILIGMHGFHVLVGLAILFYLLSSLKKPLSFDVLKTRITVCSMYWYFVVGLWPFLYILVYLS